ncbi:sulfur carrier protein ThiS [Castellaniella sp.]|uniref:sulfur carrier protein ThiS n=2 Tax=Castellaniella sp. TaxID=1955812 RepID=UPI003A59968E
MSIHLNGQATTLDNVQTVQDLITHLGYQDKRIAVERNGDIVPRSQHATTQLADQDHLEIVIAVGGGINPDI